MKNQTIAVLGAGSWGTAVAIHLARTGHHVLLWAHTPQHANDLLADHCNRRYLPDIIFPDTLTPTAHLDECIETAPDKHLIIATPSHAFEQVLSQITQRPKQLSWLTKGVDPVTHKLLSRLVSEKWGNDLPIAIISGPSFAREVAQGLPTALVIASNNTAYSKTLRAIFHHDNLRVYLSDDYIGVQLCGAVKNVLAIACGVSDGLHFGANAKAALITRGLAEMSRLGACLGAKQDTFIGLAGVGDLVLTCTDNQSRNRRFGLEIGRGIPLLEAEQHIGQVVEGKHNAAQVCAIAHQFGVDMPICKEVNDLLTGHITAHQAVTNLMTRPPRDNT
jgi:glycerol-3-phosphate dehydrogenase (NAD(P)+)